MAGMTFWDHLEELRWSILRVVIALAVVLVGCFVALPHIFDPVILGPTTSDFFLYRWLALAGLGAAAKPFSVDIININVTAQFVTHISTAFWLSLVLVFPYLVFELWRFVRPALYDNEKKPVRKAFASGTALFYIGCAVGYCIVFPLTFRFLAEYQIGAGAIVNQISLNSYIGNFLGIIFVMGVVFEMPMLAWALSALGILHKDFLKKYRRHAVVVLMALAALITPSGDPFTLTVVFLPLYLLYELSIAIVKK
ncbi:MAG: twin-arginine translocase subunit TatC [Bacteroidales bacterium]|nr:twin-arginine translocase subunit TatC [Candidatus Cryptobacteroides aphodequi]